METRAAQPPGFGKIAQSLREGNTSKIIVNFPQERTPMPNLWVGTAAMMTSTDCGKTPGHADLY